MEFFTGLEEQVWMVLDIFIAMVLGGIIGYEREARKKPAGFRTNMLIAGASALFLFLGRSLALSMQSEMGSEALGVDPTRLIHAIIVGISFIGAGTVLKSPKEQEIKYLTTAATILLSAGVGICVAMHYYLLAVGVTILGLIVNSVLKLIE